MPFRESLLEHGFSYLVLQDFAHLKKGAVVRLLEAEYHQAPQSDDGGYILKFSDGDHVALDHLADSGIIAAIGEYLKKGGPFDWSEGVEEYGAAFREGRALYHQAVREDNRGQNQKAAAAVENLVKQGLSPKEAYQKYLKARGG